MTTDYERESPMETSSSRHAPLTRDQVLIAHAQNQIARTNLSQDDFAQALSRQLHLACPDQAKDKVVPDFEALATTNDASEFMKATGRWLKRVQRWLSGESEMPSWLEESWVNALEPSFRDHCLNELASRHGLTGARRIQSEACANLSFGSLIRAMGNLIDSGSEVFDDQVMCEKDLHLLPEFAKHCRQAEAKAGELGRKAEAFIAASARPVPHSVKVA